MHAYYGCNDFGVRQPLQQSMMLFGAGCPELESDAHITALRSLHSCLFGLSW